MKINQEIIALRELATNLAKLGDVISAIVFDDYAYALSRGRTWEQLIDDVIVRESVIH
jgi:hypothetical protein